MTTRPPISSLSRSAPEAEGISSHALLDFVNAVDTQIRDLHSLMIVRHGRVVAEGWWSPYEPGRRHMLFSLSKSFTSTAAGLAIEAGLFSLDDPVASFFPDEAPAHVSSNLAAMRVRHLLSMSTGHSEESLGAVPRVDKADWIRAFLERPVEYEPGTHFLYNSGATYMVSAIVQKVTGQRVLDYLEPRLFGPLGITDAAWETCPRGINTGGWGLSIKTEDIARFGQLYLQRGEWAGRRLVPERWVQRATSRQMDNGDDPNNDWSQGYGYQFWRCRHNAFRGDGAFGQFCVVMPEQDAVLATTAGVGDMQGVLNLAWKHLLPAMGTESLQEDDAGRQALDGLLRSLSIRAPEGESSAPLCAAISSRTYRLEPNDLKLEWVRFEAGDELELVLGTATDEHRMPCGMNGAWAHGMTSFDSPAKRHTAGSAAWPAADTLTVKVCLTDTPFIRTITFRFAGSQIFVDYRQNVSFGPTEHPQIEGRLEI